jgi:ribosomal protein L22
MHRFIMGAKKEDIVDHINGNKCDNRKANLRFVTKAQNSQNSRKPRATSGFIGVSSYNGYHAAYIKIFGKRRHLGMFKDPIDAAKRYDEEARKVYGPNARTNKRHFAEILRRLNGKKTRNSL